MALETNNESVSETNTEEIVADSYSSTEGEGIAASLGLNSQLFVFQLINFTIVAVIVWFMILKPLLKKMEERKIQIDESIDNAKRVETNLFESERQYQKKIDEAKVEANKVIEKAHEEGVRLGKMLKEKSRSDIELLVAQAKKNIEIDKQEMKAEIKKETAEIVILALEKILSEKFDSKKDGKFIEEVLKEVKK
ncbi:MAG: ATP synthase F0 subunit B [Candidatus Magasanikbacteria bacterium RIFCSPHIGHO2_01_FULL_33_34]|uniref:ATP synthase subunit b n=1 Tax=Candidatus Magasanikbacteria bacterium RIFCSPHIGHO2_01_FULL_33_34 TaxID=1798671 RepID=A0A1F6LL55_9BACT|nr:MAG: ATP synthase F0 subunit B [Candidatus Magasanikbacteria bacterium RIFCSPHIGHO2_01_FULL_33_34]OGH65843.1 MAG: ATP synthase F0 subunit B [Candidatus Magasanikbacteria bacterium RIFCSPHIGHO2_02_FULL_33_17]OGH75208.1 MAG: ATP synthase F0 subunit B [Candidatus Magasanikbacteria bacterium RIFCSPLOWO2_01_FULL_33_34]